MTREEAIDYLEWIRPKKPYTQDKKNVQTAIDMSIEALKRPHGNWEYLKEHITEMRDADGELNQKQTCKFILNLMGVIEKEGGEK